MANVADTSVEDRSLSGQLQHNWGWFVALGVILLLLGFVAIGNLLAATIASVLFIGVLMIFSGVAQAAHAFRVKGWAGFLFWLISGILYGAAGVLTFYNPLLAASVLTLLIGISLIVAGAFRLVIGWRLRPSRGWGWIVAAGVVTVATGILVMVGWPVTALWLLGMILAVDLTFQGVALIAFGLALRRL